MAKKAAKDGLVWTPAGRVALAAELDRGVPVCRDADVRTLVRDLVNGYGAAWKRGLAKSDDVGKAAIAFATTWKAGGKKKAYPAQLAGLVVLACANGDDAYAPVIELVVRDYGFEVAMHVLVKVWSLAARYDMKKTSASMVSWVYAVADDDLHVHDTSATSGKYEMTTYLQRRHREGSAADRAAMKAAVDAVWKSAPRHAKAALAVATNDGKRAAQIARELLVHDTPHPFYAWEELPHVLTDAALVEQVLPKRRERMSYRIVANLGVAAIPLFEAQLSSRMDKHARTRFLQQLANLRSPVVARILAEYAEVKPYAEIVRTYFAMHADLLQVALADPELKYHHEDLATLQPQTQLPL